jgi:hypothetical protein
LLIIGAGNKGALTIPVGSIKGLYDMAAFSFDNWSDYRDILKPVFGNRRNWQRFCFIHDRMRLRLLCGVV